MKLVSVLRQFLLGFLLNHWPKVLVNHWWKQRFGYTIDWEYPRDINEKIWWLLVYSDTTEWTRLSDKIKVRGYVKNKGLEELLVPLLGNWDDAFKINFDKMPQKFVLKCNHDSGSTIYIDKMKSYNKVNICKSLNRSLKKEYGLNGEIQYRGIIPRMVIAEEALENDYPQISSSIIDYKVWCFNGKPFGILTCHNRTDKTLCLCMYDLNWKAHAEWCVFSSHYINGGDVIPRPGCLDEMLKSAAKLSEGFPEVRVDFYISKGKLYLGEMTFSSMRGMMGYYTPDILRIMGDKCDLTKTKRK